MTPLSAQPHFSGAHLYSGTSAEVLAKMAQAVEERENSNIPYLSQVVSYGSQQQRGILIDGKDIDLFNAEKSDTQRWPNGWSAMLEVLKMTMPADQRKQWEQAAEQNVGCQVSHQAQGETYSMSHIA